MSDDRELFEAWAGDQGFSLTKLETSDDYLDLRTQGPWEAWQAARRAEGADKLHDAITPEQGEVEKNAARPGWVMVPVEPTPAMLDAVMAGEHGDADWLHLLRTQYAEDWQTMARAAIGGSHG